MHGRLRRPVVPDVYSQNAGESAVVEYTAGSGSAVGEFVDRVDGQRGVDRRAGGDDAAHLGARTQRLRAATSPNGAVTASIRARESCSSSASPSACTIVDTGTGTAPIRIAARYMITKSGESAMNSSTRCSGSSPIDTQSGGRAQYAIVQFGVGQLAARPGDRQTLARRLRRYAGRAGTRRR